MLIQIVAFFLIQIVAFGRTNSECDFLKRNSFSNFAKTNHLSRIAQNSQSFLEAANTIDAKIQEICTKGFTLGDKKPEDLLNRSYVWGRGCRSLQSISEITSCSEMISEYIKFHDAYRAGMMDATKGH